MKSIVYNLERTHLINIFCELWRLKRIIMISKLLLTILRGPTFALQLSGSGLGTVGGNTLESYNQGMFSTDHLPQIIYHYILYIFTVAGNTMETLNQEMFSTNHFPHVTSHHHHCCQVNHHICAIKIISPHFMFASSTCAIFIFLNISTAKCWGEQKFRLIQIQIQIQILIIQIQLQIQTFREPASRQY